jgi:hypothetical protein
VGLRGGEESARRAERVFLRRVSNRPCHGRG